VLASCFISTFDKFYEILISLHRDEREEGLEPLRGQDTAVPQIVEGGEKMECDCSKNGRRISNLRTNWQAVPREVCPPSPRYHNHLDSAIITTDWTEREDLLLHDLHEEFGNKWSSIAQNLPGRYHPSHSGPTTA
jgi:hypothetical protein